MEGGRINAERFDRVGLALLTLLTRVPFMSREPYDMDSVNFLLGIAHYSPELHQPHSPGYFLYIMTGRLIAALVGDAHLAFLILSIVATMLAAWGVYALAKLWYGLMAARFAALILIFSPLVWFHGEVALTYAVEMDFSAWMGVWAWRVWRGEQRLAFPLALLLAIAAGFRQSTALFLLECLPEGGFSLLVASLANRSKIGYFQIILLSDKVTWSEESGMALIHLPSSLLPRLYPGFARQSVCGGGA